MKNLLLILFIVFVSCSSKTKLEKMIEHHIESVCGESSKCKIKLSDVTWFEWDKLIVFKETAQSLEVDSIIGIKYPYFGDLAKRVVFMNDNKIVYHEDVFPNYEGLIDGEIIFNVLDTSNYKIFLNTEFTIQKLIEEKKYYYIIDQ